MTEANMPTRRYHAPRRTEQAAATRRAILAAAYELFADRGYAATTMAAIADKAGVTSKSVHAVAEKPQLLLLTFDHAVVGDEKPVAMAERTEFRALVETKDPHERARLAGRLGAEVLLRLYPIYRAFEQGAATDPRLHEAWRDQQRRRRADIRILMRGIADAGGLRDGLTIDAATDTIWAVMSWHPIALLVEEQGWSQGRLTRWIEELFLVLLGPRETSPTTT
jgi:AcrR family transcriptional regulator